MKKIVVLSGAGISAESGIKTFREMGGVWEEYDVMEVASPQAWESNPELVMRFYNERRKKILKAEPNEGHKGLVDLERQFAVQIITQNVDDLHERAGSKNILHLHGEIRKARSTYDSKLISDIEGCELKIGDKCEKGYQLRPHIVWFGEDVPAISEAAAICEKAEILIIVGTSLNVYPAAGLINYVPTGIPIYLIDPNDVKASNNNIIFIKEKASTGIKKLIELLQD